MIHVNLQKMKYICILLSSVNSKVTEMHRADFANSVDLDEVGHDEPPHPDLHW